MSYKVGDLVFFTGGMAPDGTHVRSVLFGIISGPFTWKSENHYNVRNMSGTSLHLDIPESDLSLSMPSAVPPSPYAPVLLPSSIPPCPIVRGFKVGDKVSYKGIDAIISHTLPYSVHGEAQYDITTLIGAPQRIVASESELILLNSSLPTGLSALGRESSPPTIKSLESKGNGCQCGAWATTYQDDHMSFCPKFKEGK